MKATSVVVVILLISIGLHAQSSFYELKAETITGETLEFSQLKGKRILIVNTASKCGYTKQYADLEDLYKQYGGEKLEIIGFPANNFMNQEPGTNEEILEFCTTEFGVSFPMMAKISVKGDDMHPVYRWLTSASENGVMDSEVQWNFQKYLIDKNGTLVDVIKTGVKPNDEKIIKFIKQ